MSDLAGLSCGHAHAHARDHGHLAAARSDDRRETTTRNVDDLRRARQRARSVIRTLEQRLIDRFLGEEGIDLATQRDERQLNERITRLAARTVRSQLLDWLSSRRRQAMGRAIRAAFERMGRTFAEPVPDDAFAGTPTLEARDRDLNQELNQIDAGLLYTDDDSLAEEIGNRVTRQLRTGFARNETPDELAERVAYVLTDGSGDGRQKAGVSGQTAMSKAELISHDSIQDAYMSAAHRRYLENGFRYAVYDATVDFKTTALCRRLDEVVVDLVETPFLVPPNHPWCRSGIRPVLNLQERTPIGEDGIADSYLNTIMSTKSHRPKALDTQEAFRPTRLTDQYTPTGA